MAPGGTVTDKEVVLAAEILAFTAPKNTILFAGTGLKLLPVIITVAPTGPDSGVKEVMDGACAIAADKPEKIAISRLMICMRQNFDFIKGLI